MTWDEFSKEDDWHNYLNWEWRNIIEPKWKLYFYDLSELTNDSFDYQRDEECENRINLILKKK